ncbi:hypothetical protein [Streptomyces adelaidensis]|uniref:hypothetical protein n=1 Tax=Streptomyces adelaidensis TaxID=2796465 RepID=UPI001907DDF9|nr:hypothetical protein [Streptomyces adelaidensis]
MVVAVASMLLIVGGVVWAAIDFLKFLREEKRMENPFYALRVRKYEAVVKMRAITREHRNRSTQYRNTRR